jgi:SAM-dependent methyltransferase
MTDESCLNDNQAAGACQDEGMDQMTSNSYSQLWFRLFMPLQSEELTQREVEFLARQLPLPHYRRVLDLCCGYGRHAIGLASHGYEVTGLDRDAGAITEASRRTLAAGQDVAYVAGDMRAVGELPDIFDAAINMWQSLSYFDDETNARLLRDIHDKLTPGGRFIVDMYHRDFFERNQGHKRQEIDGVTVETDGYMEGDRWHALLTYRGEQGEERGSDHMEWQLFTPDEFSALAAACGFAPLLVCMWVDESRPPAPDIARFQIVLGKPSRTR